MEKTTKKVTLIKVALSLLSLVAIFAEKEKRAREKKEA